MSTIVLSAGGTGGHLFPAQALAGELIRRGKKIVVMTDARGKQLQRRLSRRGDRDRAVGGFLRPLVLRPRHRAVRDLGRHCRVACSSCCRSGPRAVIGFGGYPSRAGDAGGACFARLPTAILAPDAVLGRANRLVMN